MKNIIPMFVILFLPKTIWFFYFCYRSVNALGITFFLLVIRNNVLSEKLKANLLYVRIEWKQMRKWASPPWIIIKMNYIDTLIICIYDILNCTDMWEFITLNMIVSRQCKRKLKKVKCIYFYFFIIAYMIFFVLHKDHYIAIEKHALRL